MINRVTVRSGTDPCGVFAGRGRESRMELFKYRADILPEITYAGYHDIDYPYRNIRRVCEDYIFYLVTDGEMYLEEDGKSYHLKKGDCFLLEAGKLHFGTRDTYYHLFFIHFRHPAIKKITVEEEAWTKQLPERHSAWLTSMERGPFPENGIVLEKHFRLEDRNDFSAIRSMIERMLERQMVHLENFNVLCSCAVTEIFVEIYRRAVMARLQNTEHGAEGSQRVNEVLHYLNSNYKRKLTGAVLEKELSYNFDYLNQLFRKHLGISIFKMLENIRMEAARNILQTRALSVKYTANEVGYADETYFSKVFKKHTGFSPAAYRRNRQ